MPDLQTLLMFATASLALAVIPGPTMLLALSNGMAGGMRRAGWGIAGATLGSGLVIAVVAVGLGSLLAAVSFDIVPHCLLRSVKITCAEDGESLVRRFKLASNFVLPSLSCLNASLLPNTACCEPFAMRCDNICISVAVPTKSALRFTW